LSYAISIYFATPNSFDPLTLLQICRYIQYSDKRSFLLSPSAGCLFSSLVQVLGVYTGGKLERATMDAVARPGLHYTDLQRPATCKNKKAVHLCYRKDDRAMRPM